MKPGRNAPCNCGSGKKYKHCCAGKTAPRAPTPADFNNLATLFASGRYVELESRARLLLERYPEAGFCWKALALSLQAQGKNALSALQNAAQLLPDDADAHNNLGNALYELGRIDHAMVGYRHAIKINPRFAVAHNNLGTVLKDMGQIHDAVASYRQALEIKFDFVDAHYNLGIALKILGNVDDAVASYQMALAFKPNDADAHFNLGIAQQEIGKFDSALFSYCRALDINPGPADVHINCAYLLLSLGDFKRGWQEYEWRDARYAIEHRIKAPLLKANALLPFTSAGKRILLCHEQGIGDEPFFLRFAPQLRKEAQWVGYWSTPKVQSLIERSGCVDQVFSRFDEAPQTDLIVPVGDLPLLLGCYSAAVIPPSLRFSPTEQHVAKVRQHLSDLGLTGQRLLGVTWRGGSPPVPGKTKTLFKQIDLNSLADAIKGWQGAIVVLQRAPAAVEIEQLRAHVSCPVYDLSDYNDDLELMLVLLDVLDEYAGVSNANMHLMAGLGKTARVLIPFPAEWRWMASGEQSPWFPGFVLYRQTVGGEWGQALDALKHDLSIPSKKHHLPLT